MRINRLGGAVALALFAGAGCAQEPIGCQIGACGKQAQGYDDGTGHIVNVGKASPLPIAPPATIIASASFTTPVGTTAYASGNLIANAAAAASVTPLGWTACRAAGGTGMVRRLRLKTGDTGFAGATVRVHLHQLAPSFANGDHGAWLTSESNYLGALDVTFDRSFSDAVKGIGTPNAGSEINFDCASGSQSVYGEIEARGPITPQGAKAITAVIEVLAN
ncbi:hypothetical protein [Sphingomonas bacterium]|uniref:hypothetical protein n=1 Tax=Sphingomonas bacterium TaxID=1895847 RepID=UPI001575E89F|nr:hypothetical protein [Sphingomonas bacterium]